MLGILKIVIPKTSFYMGSLFFPNSTGLLLMRMVTLAERDCNGGCLAPKKNRYKKRTQK